MTQITQIAQMSETLAHSVFAGIFCDFSGPSAVEGGENAEEGCGCPREIGSRFGWRESGVALRLPPQSKIRGAFPVIARDVSVAV
jgi:hypothetical protein